MADTTQMRDLLGYITQELVSYPEAVAIQEEAGDEGAIRFLVKANKEDLGRLIGRNGKTAKSIRQVVSVLAADEGVSIEVEFVE